ncbi:hypothetical protein SNE40_017327 [Patella caerulea]|uniref:Uncharacterized protein n=1 Tax=Patella caerulea TaxID=87958 RepID=A0AAN8JDL8_PATCE
MEIMENDLYIPFENSAVEVSKPTTSSVYDNAVECGTRQDVAAPEMKIETKQNVATPEMEILENDLYVPFEDTDKVAYDNVHKAANKSSDQAAVMEILENDLYVPFEKTQE